MQRRPRRSPGGRRTPQRRRMCPESRCWRRGNPARRSNRLWHRAPATSALSCATLLSRTHVEFWPTCMCLEDTSWRKTAALREVLNDANSARAPGFPRVPTHDRNMAWRRRGSCLRSAPLSKTCSIAPSREDQSPVFHVAMHTGDISLQGEQHIGASPRIQPKAIWSTPANVLMVGMRSKPHQIQLHTFELRSKSPQAKQCQDCRNPTHFG